jgi:hypothetical protein
MPQVITLSGLQQLGAAVEGCAALGDKMEVVVIDGRTYCRSTETGKIYDPATGDEYKGEVKGSRLLNYAVSVGVGAVVGLIVAMAGKKKASVARGALGAGVGGLAGAAILAMTWPKAKAPEEA